MVEIAVILLVVAAFAGGFGLAAAHAARRSVRGPVRRPSPRAMPATQTADVHGRAGADPGGAEDRYPLA